jgi:hypothetical protein
MATLKYYDTATSEWKTLIVGAKGEKGDTGDQGETGLTGPEGPEGLGSVSVTAPITNSGTSTEANIGIDLTDIAPIASPTFTGTVTGTPADGTTSTAANGLGFMGIPQSAVTTGSYTITAADSGEHIYASSTRTVTIPANSSVALPVGTTIVFIAGSGATMTIAITTDTLLVAGSGVGGAGTSRTLAPHGIATAIKVTSTLWYISGNGLS